MDRNFKCVFCGEGDVGKRSMLTTYTTGSYPQDYIPRVVDKCITNVMIYTKQIKLELWNTAGQEDYDRLRPLNYPSSDVIVICFAVDSVASFESVRNKWYPEIQHHAPGVPFILVGTKLDLRADGKGETFVSKQMGEQLKDELKAYKYLECSAFTQEGLKQVFEEAARCVLIAQSATGKEGKSKCTVM